jgi:isopenicillin N synthase-like dioxygenase
MTEYAEPVPVVDFSRLLNGEEDLQARATIHQACCDSGFFYLKGFGIGGNEIAAVENAMQWFFALPAEAKQTVARSEENSRGYYNNELTKNIRDMKEVFDFGFKNNYNLPDDDISNLTQDGWNQWPLVAGSSHFKAVLDDYFERCSSVALKLLQVLTANLGAPVETLTGDFFPLHSSFLRLNYYPVGDPLALEKGEHTKSADTGSMGVHHHTDAGALTLLLQDDVGGLEVFHQNTWKSVPPIADTLVVNIGDIVKVWSNDLYHAALHRVVASREQDRYSIPFFFNPLYSANYAPLPEILGKSVKPHYSPINWGHFRHERQHGDYGDYGDEVQISDFRID